MPGAWVAGAHSDAPACLLHVKHSVRHRVDQQSISDTDTILGKAGFKTKGWLLSGESEVLTDLRTVSNQAPNPSTTKVLGVEWVSASDEITYSMDQQTQLFTEVMVTDRLTRRRALERVMKIYDPLGILSPFTLRAKIYLFPQPHTCTI